MFTFTLLAHIWRESLFHCINISLSTDINALYARVSIRPMPCAIIHSSSYNQGNCAFICNAVNNSLVLQTHRLTTKHGLVLDLYNMVTNNKNNYLRVSHTPAYLLLHYKLQQSHKHAKKGFVAPRGATQDLNRPYIPICFFYLLHSTSNLCVAYNTKHSHAQLIYLP